MIPGAVHPTISRKVSGADPSFFWTCELIDFVHSVVGSPVGSVPLVPVTEEPLTRLSSRLNVFEEVVRSKIVRKERTNNRYTLQTRSTFPLQ